MKLFDFNGNILKLGPTKFSFNANLERILLLVLVIWLPLKDWPIVSGVIGGLGGIIAPVLVLCLLIVIMFGRGFIIEIGKIEKAFLVFLALTVISSILSVLIYGFWLPVIKDGAVIFELFFLYLLGKNLKKDDFKLALKIGVLEATAIATSGIWQFITKAPISPLWVIPGEALRTRAFAIFNTPNALASYLLIWLWISVWLGTKKKAWFIATPVILLSLYFTYSRSALLAFVLGLLVLFIINFRKVNWKIISGVVVGGVISLIFFAKRLLNIFNPLYTYYSEEAGRFWAIKNVLHVLPNHLFWGVGPGMYGGQTATVIPSPVYLESIQHGFVATYLTDNQYLQILIQQGIFGVISYLYLLWELTRQLIMRAKNDLYYGGAILAIWVGYSFQGLFENIWFIQVTATIVWIIIGVGLQEKR